MLSVDRARRGCAEPFWPASGCSEAVRCACRAPTPGRALVCRSPRSGPPGRSRPAPCVLDEAFDPVGRRILLGLSARWSQAPVRMRPSPTSTPAPPSAMTIATGSPTPSRASETMASDSRRLHAQRLPDDPAHAGDLVAGLDARLPYSGCCITMLAMMTCPSRPTHRRAYDVCAKRSPVVVGRSPA